MSFQYYENLQDKSAESLQYYLKHIKPSLSNSEIDLIAKDLDQKPPKKKSKLHTDFVDMEFDTTDEDPDISKIDEKFYPALYKIFISNEEVSDKATKWKFYKFLKYIKEINIKSVHININEKKHEYIDMLIESEDDGIIIVSCINIIDFERFNEAKENIVEFCRQAKINPEQIIFSATKSYRNISIDDPIKVGNHEIIPEFWMEWFEPERPFHGEDLLIVNDKDNYTLAGFNFNGTQDLLDYVYQKTEGGQIAVYKQRGFFSELAGEQKETIELIWKGIVIKT